MKTISFLLVALAFATLSAHSVAKGSRSTSATVSLSILDSFGKQRQDCHVIEFSSSYPYHKAELKARFSGYTATEIPFGWYRIRLRCDDLQHLGPEYVYVERNQEFFVVSQWRHFGDYVTGPRLAVNLETAPDVQLSKQAWIRAVGIYTKESEVSKIDPASHSASFYDIVPGRYLLLLLDGEQIVCSKPVDFLESDAKLSLSISTEGCATSAISGVKALN